jgi:hypothetical protein
VLGVCWAGSFLDGTVRRDKIHGKGAGRTKEEKDKEAKQEKDDQDDQKRRERKEEKMGDKKEQLA